MIAETIGGYNARRTYDLYTLRDKARADKPKCHRCGEKLAYDRAEDALPSCNDCSKAGHAHINTSGGRETKNGAHKGPPTVAIPRLFTVRTRLNVSRTKLAKLAHSDVKTIKRIEEGAYQRARPETAQRYADALGARLEDLQ